MTRKTPKREPVYNFNKKSKSYKELLSEKKELDKDYKDYKIN